MNDLLIVVPENPPPEGMNADLFQTKDGVSIRFARAPGRGAEKHGTVVILPGRNEYIEKYFETANDLTERGYGAAILDWRGQGRSQRLLPDANRGYVESFDDYVRDLDAFFEQVVLPDCRGPYYILAHSTGVLIALLAAPMMANRVRRMVLCTPLLGLPVSPRTTRWVSHFAQFLYAFGFGKMYMPGRRNRMKMPEFSPAALSSDPQRFARNRATVSAWPGLAINGPTVAWTRAMFLAIERVTDPAFAARIHIPSLILSAGADRVVSNPAIERFSRQLRSTSLLTIDGARHELLQEADLYREQVMAAFFAFVEGTGDINF
ncbi:alpha/beta hydrolase [Nitratireductor aquimarinus]|uniref:alpha/beta hydrolase n=1 Tax=Nitratireductor TaxID=245876 RepID=UPI0019D380DA|nr:MULTISPECIES: alpha/beta hydrolase [Nitratireductor]MBN7775252.1 alpha/beta hydrolase [Nitratireductor pacificus]MBN7781266.1 alpha/beta hydrolase [Nitratireductor pacificus]MBN7790072.1 alpha/beta hydrolase [Nitratireductor aquimarinus]MBY6097639.1 alpha/beta hydrolase [Nitratireductor aquimarinus]